MKVIAHGVSPAYLAGEDGQPVAHQHLQQTTFVDYNGAVHTVHTHVDGPYEDAHEVIAAFFQGDLHAEPAESPDEQPSDDSAQKE